MKKISFVLILMVSLIQLKGQSFQFPCDFEPKLKDNLITNTDSILRRIDAINKQNRKSTKDFVSMKLDSMNYLYYYDSTNRYLENVVFSYDNHGRTREINWYYCDSTLPFWGNQVRYTYTYNSKGLLTSWWKFVSFGVPFYKTYGEEYFYDTRDSLVQQKRYDWDPNSNSLKLSWLLDIEYNSLGLKSRYISEVWEYVYSNHYKGKVEYQYYPNLLMSQQRAYGWSFSQSAWTPGGYLNWDYLYDSLGNRTEEIHLEPTLTAGQYVPDYRITYFYDNSFNKIEIVRDLWDTISSDWIINADWKYYYDSISRLIGMKSEFVNSFGIMNPYDSLSYIYNSLNFETNNFYLKYSVQDSNWIFQYMNYFELDSGGNELKYYHCRWDSLFNQWDSLLLRAGIYCDSFLNQDIMLPSSIDDINYPLGFYIDFNSHHMILESFEYNCPCGFQQYYLKAHRTYFYSNINPSSIQETYEKKVKIYPNPARDEIQIDLFTYNNGNTISILNSMGQLIRTAFIRSSSIKINIKDYNPGIYYFRIESDDFTTSHKVIIE